MNPVTQGLEEAFNLPHSTYLQYFSICIKCESIVYIFDRYVFHRTWILLWFVNLQSSDGRGACCEHPLYYLKCSLAWRFQTSVKYWILSAPLQSPWCLSSSHRCATWSCATNWTITTSPLGIHKFNYSCIVYGMHVFSFDKELFTFGQNKVSNQETVNFAKLVIQTARWLHFWRIKLYIQYFLNLPKISINMLFGLRPLPEKKIAKILLHLGQIVQVDLFQRSCHWSISSKSIMIWSRLF